MKKTKQVRIPEETLIKIDLVLSEFVKNGKKMNRNEIIDMALEQALKEMLRGIKKIKIGYPKQ